MITFDITYDDFVKIDDNVITTETITRQRHCKRVQTVCFVQWRKCEWNDDEGYVDEDNIDDVDEKVDDNQSKGSIVILGQYVQQVDKVPDSICMYLNEIDNCVDKNAYNNKQKQKLTTLDNFVSYALRHGMFI